MWFILFGAAELGHAHSVIHVRSCATGAENGTCWSDAFCDLHDALASADSGDEIWIAAGTYKPDRGSGERSMQFQVPSGVAIYGGFAGFETERGQRDWVINETILSGDLNGDDGPFNCSDVSNCCKEHEDPGCDDAECQALVCSISEYCCEPGGTWIWDDGCAQDARRLCCGLGSGYLCDNSHQVVDASWTEATTVLDGLTVTGGYADNSREGTIGAGILVENGAPRLENCTVSGSYHGIWQYSGSRVDLLNCSVRDNLDMGIYGCDSCDLTVRRSSISGNGIGCNVSGGSTTITDSMFSDNLQSGLGGGSRSSSVLLTGCVFLRNGFGGIQSSGGDYVIRDCLFAENLAGSSGGISVRDTAIIERCAFIANNSHSIGALRVGGIVTVRDSLFMGNAAEHGCISIGDGALRLRNSTIVANRGGISGALSVHSPKALAIVDNAILWGNVGNLSESTEKQQIQIPSTGGELHISHSIVEGWTGLYGGVGNLGDDPLFVDADGSDDTPGTPDDDLRVLAGSPAINSGDPTFPARNGETDFDGRPRVLCGRVDIGAFEFGIGDYDCDGTVELNDFAAWAGCGTGPANGPLARGCESFDFDGDADIDLTDFAGLQVILGPPDHAWPEPIRIR